MMTPVQDSLHRCCSIDLLAAVFFKANDNTALRPTGKNGVNVHILELFEFDFSCYSRELVAHVPFIYELIPQVQAQLHGRLACADAQQIYTVEYEWINRRREVCRGKQSGSHYV